MMVQVQLPDGTVQEYPEGSTPYDIALKIGARLQKLCETNGVISRALPGDALAFSPPLIITEAEADEIVSILVPVIKNFLAETA